MTLGTYFSFLTSDVLAHYQLSKQLRHTSEVLRQGSLGKAEGDDNYQLTDILSFLDHRVASICLNLVGSFSDAKLVRVAKLLRILWHYVCHCVGL